MLENAARKGESDRGMSGVGADREKEAVEKKTKRKRKTGWPRMSVST